MCEFHSESSPYIDQNVKELFAQNKCNIWSLSYCNWTRTHNHLVSKRTRNHLTKQAKWLSRVVITYLYSAVDYMFLSCHVRISKWVYTLYSTECQGTPCSKQVQYLNFKWLQLELNPQSLSSKTNTQPFGQTGQMIELCCEYLSVQCIGLYLPVMSRTRSQWIYTLYLSESEEFLSSK